MERHVKLFFYYEIQISTQFLWSEYKNQKDFEFDTFYCHFIKKFQILTFPYKQDWNAKVLLQLESQTLESYPYMYLPCRQSLAASRQIERTTRVRPNGIKFIFNKVARGIKRWTRFCSKTWRWIKLDTAKVVLKRHKLH